MTLVTSNGTLLRHLRTFCFVRFVPKLIYSGLILESLADQMLLNGMCMNARNNKNMQFNQNVSIIQNDDFGSKNVSEKLFFML